MQRQKRRQEKHARNGDNEGCIFVIDSIEECGGDLVASAEEASEGGNTVSKTIELTLKRLNIISDIPRPADQQCTESQGNWTESFQSSIKARMVLN
jgi:hypothetical protein